MAKLGQNMHSSIYSTSRLLHVPLRQSRAHIISSLPRTSTRGQHQVHYISRAQRLYQITLPSMLRERHLARAAPATHTSCRRTRAHNTTTAAHEGRGEALCAWTSTDLARVHSVGLCARTSAGVLGCAGTAAQGSTRGRLAAHSVGVSQRGAIVRLCQSVASAGRDTGPSDKRSGSGWGGGTIAMCGCGGPVASRPLRGAGLRSDTGLVCTSRSRGLPAAALASLVPRHHTQCCPAAIHDCRTRSGDRCNSACDGAVIACSSLPTAPHRRCGLAAATE